MGLCWCRQGQKNLIIIQLESFQSFLLSLKVDGQEVTPNLNRLMEQSLYFTNFYQMVGQGNTSDAEFVVNSSFYIPPQGAATMSYIDKQLPSLPRLLGDNGYQTATFHTNVVEFWNRGELYKALGWENYYDHKFFGDEDAFFFGASDEVLYRKSSEKAEGNERRREAVLCPGHLHVCASPVHYSCREA
ncbi:LTA synthase family protein [Paenibacillus rhizoplanae]